MSPCLSTAIVMFSGFVCVGKLVAFGRSNCTCWMMTRIVMMKMIRSTNITSTRGVTLMSDIASASSPPTFIAMDFFLHTFIATQQDIVAQHGGNRDGQTDGGHDQGLTDGSCDLVDGCLSGDA